MLSLLEYVGRPRDFQTHIYSIYIYVCIYIYIYVCMYIYTYIYMHNMHNMRAMCMKFIDIQDTRLKVCTVQPSP
jgi:hypothetical protein